MKYALTTFAIGTLAIFVLPLRRLRVTKPAAAAEASAPVMDAATYAAMLAEAERIAAPFEEHIRSLRATPQSAGDFADVEALLDRAGLLAI